MLTCIQFKLAEIVIFYMAFQNVALYDSLYSQFVTRKLKMGNPITYVPEIDILNFTAVV
jgi:hypothetical protein